MESKPRNPRRLFGWLGRDAERTKLLDAARQAYDPDRVLALLAEAPGNLPNLQDHRLWAHKEKQRQAQLQYARQHGRWDRVLAVLEKAPPDYPNLASLRTEAVAAQRLETNPTSAPAPEDFTPGHPVEAPGLAEPGRATVQLGPQPGNSLAPAEVDLGLEQRADNQQADVPAVATAAAGERQESPPPDRSPEGAAASVVDEALEEIRRQLPGILRRFDREEIDRVIELCRQHSALEGLLLRVEPALASEPGNLAALALAGGASARREHGTEALVYYEKAIEAIERGVRRQDWLEYFYLHARTLDPSRAFAMIDCGGGVFDTEEGRRYLFEQALALGPEEQARQTALGGLLAVDECRRASGPLLAARAVIRYLATR